MAFRPSWSSFVFFLGIALPPLGTGCAGPETELGSTAAAEREESLSLDVTSVTMKSGGVRIEATMEGGSADVYVTLGSRCALLPVGGGLATPSRLVWSLSASDLERALDNDCGIQVVARGVDADGVRFRASADLRVDIAVANAPVDDPKGAAGLGSADRASTGDTTAAGDSPDVIPTTMTTGATEGTETRLTFSAPSRVERIRLGSAIIGAEPEPETVVDDDSFEANTPKPAAYTSEFVVSNRELARAVVRGGTLTAGATLFSLTVVVGGVEGGDGTAAASEGDEPPPEGDDAVVDTSSVSTGWCDGADGASTEVDVDTADENGEADDTSRDEAIDGDSDDGSGRGVRFAIF